MFRQTRSRRRTSRRKRLCQVDRLEDRCLLSGTVIQDPVAAQVATADPGPNQVANVQLTTHASAQQMPSVAVNPLEANHVVVAYMDHSLVETGYAGIGVSVSHDGGATWKQSRVPLPAPFEQGAANPVVRFDRQGRVFVSFMAVTYQDEKPPLTNPGFFDRGVGLRSNNGIFVARSDDGGLSWSEPTAVVSHLYDGTNDVNFEVIPDLAVDTFATLTGGEPNPNYGNLYAVWTRLYAPGEFPGEPDSTGGGDIMIAVSEDGGATWQTRLRDAAGVQRSVFEFPLNFGVGVPPGLSVVDQAHVVVGPEGDLYVASTWGGRFTVHHSTDAGHSFAAPDQATESGFAFGDFANLIPQADGLPGNRFRTFPSRAIAADPVQPGSAYAADAIQNQDAQGNLLDGADVFFARSGDFGQSWESSFTVGRESAGVLNDDNDGQIATGLSPDEVTAGQALPRMAVDDQGNIALIWYDTRRDPADHLLDVFGTFSADGGETFTSNFRISDASFDADDGAFTNALGDQSFYLGDSIGLTLADNSAYAVWTDTRQGNQDIFFARYTIDPAPGAFNDRFEPNDSPDTATEVGRVVQRSLPKLAVEAGDEDWFAVEAAASGALVASAMSAEAGEAVAESVVLELWDRAGTSLLATGSILASESGTPVGRELRFPAASGERFLVRVSTAAQTAAGAPLSYSLGLQSLTADLGPQAFVSVDGNVTAGGGSLYRLEAAATGSLNVKLIAGDNVEGELGFQVLDPQDFSALAGGTPPPGPALAAEHMEPNDAIPSANATGLTGVGSVTVEGLIGDGEFGSTSGDFDYYSLEVGANREITVDVDAASLGSGLDSLVILYDSAGNFLAFNDDAGGLDSFLTFTTDRADTYFVAVMDTVSAAIAPFTPGGGTGAGTTGEYRVSISTEAVGPGSVKGAELPVTKGEELLILITGVDGSGGDFTLELSNRDQFTTGDNRVLSFPLGTGPSSVAADDLNGDGNLDLVAAGTLTDVVSVLLGNGDGTFQSPREFALGAFTTVDDEVPASGRRLVVGDFSGDGIPDVAVTNSASSDLSILLGRGDGTFETGRRFDAVETPAAIDAGDLDGDGTLDLVVADELLATLPGRGDGTFLPQRPIKVPGRVVATVPGVLLADLDNDGRLDLVFSGDSRDGVEVFLGTGDGGFTALGRFDAEREAPDVDADDLDGDGNLDLVVASLDESGVVSVLFGNGDGTFQEPALDVPAGQSVIAAEIVDFGSQVVHPDGSIVLGPPDGRLDIVVAASGASRAVEVMGEPELVILPGLSAEDGTFAGFGQPQRLATAERPIELDTGDLNDDGLPDIVAVDRNGLLAVFGQPPNIAPNTNRQSARNLGSAVHVLEPTQTIIPGRRDAWFRMTVPTEVAPDAGDEVLDISASFQHQQGPGLRMEVLDSEGAVVAEGERLRLRAPQGEELFVHVFGVEGIDGVIGTGAFTLSVTALPQVVSVEAEALLPGTGDSPGGPTTSITVVLQGERLDRATAEDPGNYVVTFLGPDGRFGTSDDRVIPIGGAGVQQPIVYNPGANVEVSSGQTFPTAVRQTVTLLFAEPLPAGSYVIELSPEIQAQPFNENEAGLLAQPDRFMGHPVVTINRAQVIEGARVAVPGLVEAPGELGDFSVFVGGTRFLTQLQNDLGALLDSLLTEIGDDPSVTDAILEQTFNRLVPGLGEVGERPTQFLAIFLDPVDIGLANENSRVIYDLETGEVNSTFQSAFFEVGGNNEFIGIPEALGVFELTIGNVAARSRGGALLLGQNFNQIINLTDEIRSGARRFSFDFGDPAASGHSEGLPTSTSLTAAAPVPIFPLFSVSGGADPSAANGLNSRFEQFFGARNRHSLRRRDSSNFTRQPANRAVDDSAPALVRDAGAAGTSGSEFWPWLWSSLGSATRGLEDSLLDEQDGEPLSWDRFWSTMAEDLMSLLDRLDRSGTRRDAETEKENSQRQPPAEETSRTDSPEEADGGTTVHESAPSTGHDVPPTARTSGHPARERRAFAA